LNNRRQHIRPQVQLVTAEPEPSWQSDTCSAPGNVHHCRPKSFGDCEGYHFREFEISIVGLSVDKPDKRFYYVRHILQKGLRQAVRDLKAQILSYVLFLAVIPIIL
jgi:hypothetical protein